MNILFKIDVHIGTFSMFSLKAIHQKFLYLSLPSSTKLSHFLYWSKKDLWPKTPDVSHEQLQVGKPQYPKYLIFDLFVYLDNRWLNCCWTEGPISVPAIRKRDSPSTGPLTSVSHFSKKIYLFILVYMTRPVVFYESNCRIAAVSLERWCNSVIRI